MTIKHLYPPAWPKVDFNFAATRQLDPRITFTRGSTGSYFDAQRILRYAAVDEPRFDHDPATGESLGLLIEEGSTNLNNNSNAISSWSDHAGSNTKTPNAGIAPDGTNTATKLYPNAGQTTCWVFRNHGSTGPATSTASIYAKADGKRYLRLFTYAGSYGACFDLQNGVVEQPVPAGQTATIEDCGNGWYRCSSSESKTSSLYQSAFLVSDLAYSADITPNGTDGVLVWGYQAEEHLFPTSYIPTSGATEDRSPDLVTADLTGDVPDEYTIITKPFGCAGFGRDGVKEELTILGYPHVQTVKIYSLYVPQDQTNVVAQINDDFWQWRVLGSSFALPGASTDGQVTVDWGDDNTFTLIDKNNGDGIPEHTFTNGSGYHTIKFRLDSGTYFYPSSISVDHRLKLISLGPAPTSMTIVGRNAFNTCTNLRTVDSTLTFLGSSGNSLLDNMDYCFNACPNLLNIPLLNTDGVQSFKWAFRNTNNNVYMAPINVTDAKTFENCWQYCEYLRDFPAGFFDNWTGTPANNCFASTWNNCPSLTAQSVENILNSIDTSGQSAPGAGPNIMIDYDTGTGTPNVTTAVTNLKSRGWTITLNGVLQ
jgi:hypothetical protein